MGVVLVLALLTCGWPAPSVAQQNDWDIQAGVAHANANGAFRTQRANGKVVTSDIDGGLLISLRVERTLTPRLGITVGGQLSEHDFIIHQDFPDGREFEARDPFRFRAVTVGVAIHLFRDRSAKVLLEPYFLYAWYDDVSLSSAGPPYDRTDNIEVNVESAPGAGMIAGLELPVHGQFVTINPWISLAVVRFTGPFPDDPTIPGSGGDIGVGFSPLSVGASVGFHF